MNQTHSNWRDTGISKHTRFMVTLVFLFLSFNAFSQQSHPVSGMVSDEETGETLIGVNIVIKGTTQGVTSDIEGMYQIDVPGPDAVLVFSYIGYETKEIPVEGRNIINVVMGPDATTLDEILVVGYGIQRRESVVGSISTMDTETIRSLPVSNVTQSLAGKLSGVQVVQPSGEVGRDEAEIFVRGQATYGDSSPLVVIDGIIREGFAQIDPNEIESINILKDASATAVYGVKGANGVIIITTRRGHEGRPQISFTTQTAQTYPTRIPQPLDSYRASLLANLHQIGGWGSSPTYNHQDIMNYRTGASPYTNPNFIWTDVMIKDFSTLRQHNVNVSGGTANIKYFISGGYMTQDGFYNHDPYTNYSRINFRSNFDIDITSDFTAAMNLGTRIEDRTNPAAAWYGSWELYRASFAESGRNLPVYNPDGSLAGNNAFPNLVGRIRDQGFFTEKRSILEMSVNLNHKLDFITDGLSVSGQLAFDDNGSMNRNYQEDFAVYEYNMANDSYAEFGEYRPLEYAWGNVYNTRKIYYELRMNYARRFGNHNFTGLLLGNRDLMIVDEQVPFASQGIVGRITYDYDARYLAEINFGFNGSENFAAGNRYGFFPAFAAGWNIINEPTMQDTGLADLFTILRIRGSMGWVGNDRIGGQRFMYLQQYEEIGGALFGIGDNWFQGIRQGTIANMDVQWEIARKSNIGIETEIGGGRFGFNVDYFYEYRDKILTTITNTLPNYVGASFSAANVGIVENRGVEMELSHNNMVSRDLSYQLSGMFSFARNKIISKDDPFMLLDYQKEEGYPIGTPLRFLVEGIFQDYNEIYHSPPQISALGGIAGNSFVYPGDLRFVDVNNDGVINRHDLVRTGYPYVPEITYSLNMGINYKSFDVTAMFQGASRASFNKNWEIMWHFSNNANVFTPHWHYWTPETAGSEEYVRLYGPWQNNEPSGGSEYSLGSGEYIRLKYAELGYTLPQNLSERLRINSLRVYLSGVNLFLWATEPYLDPDNRHNRGGNMPPVRSFNLGLNLNI